MQINQLRYFITLVEKGSFTEAAREHFVTQSALSQQIKALEQSLGVELCERKHRSFNITPAGHLLYERALTMMAEIEDITVKVQKAHQNRGSSLRLGLLSSMPRQELPKFLTERILVRTGFDLSIFYGSHDELYDLFGNGSINVFISDDSRLALSESLNKVRLYNSKMLVEVVRGLDFEHEDALDHQIDHKALESLTLYFVCEKEHAELENHMLNELLQINVDMIPVESLAEGRRLVLLNGKEQPSALIMDRSLLKEDDFTHPKTSQYHISIEGKPIKRRLSCYARKNVGLSELNELCSIVMDLSGKANQAHTKVELEPHQHHHQTNQHLNINYNHNHIAL